MTPGQCDRHRVTRSFEVSVATDQERPGTREDVHEEFHLRRGRSLELVLRPDDEVGGAAEGALDGLAELRDLVPIHTPHNEDVDVAVRPIGSGREGSEYQCDADLMKGRQAGCENLDWGCSEAERRADASSVRVVRIDGPEAQIAEAPTIECLTTKRILSARAPRNSQPSGDLHHHPRHRGKSSARQS